MQTCITCFEPFLKLPGVHFVPSSPQCMVTEISTQSSISVSSPWEQIPLGRGEGRLEVVHEYTETSFLPDSLQWVSF